MPATSATSISWQALAERTLAGEPLGRDDARAVLEAPDGDILALLGAAFEVRRAHHGLRVHIHVLENAKLGACPEDCGFCSQSSKFESPSGEAPMLSADELVEGARRAAAAHAYRYCMVTATTGPSPRDLDTICEAAQRIKSELDIELCASLGFLTEAKAVRLAESGIDRFNHNLETSERHFDKVVSTHSYRDRVRTIQLAKQAGMQTCCGGIVGLGERDDDLVDLALELRALEVDSVPVNFLDPRPGTPLEGRDRITPTDALRALCLFRFANPSADIRVAGGREVNLRSMQAMALYPANSLFTSGYLTTGGNQPQDDVQMIRDLGFEIEYVGGQPPHLEAPRRTSLPIA
jgi:biotin synthase